MKRIHRGTRNFFIAMYSLIALFTVILCVFFFNVFRKTVPDRSSPLDYEKYYVLISDEPDSDFWTQLCMGAEEYGASRNVCVKNLADDFGEHYSKEQLMRIAIASEVDGIIVNANDSKEMEDLINEAQKKGIPVVTTINDCSNSNRISYVEINNYNLGKKLGELAAKVVREDKAFEDKEEIKMAVLMDSAPSSGQSLLFTGVQDELNKSDDGRRKISAVGVNVNDSSAFSVEASLRELFISSDAPDIVACLSEIETNSAYQAAVDYNKVGDVKILGYYDSYSILQGIERGIIDCTVSIDAAQMGNYCVEALIQYDNAGYTSQYYTVDISVIDGRNVYEYLEVEDENQVR